jgi:hypothetical protein
MSEGTPRRIRLEWYEAEWAAGVGVRRQLKALEQGNLDRHGYDGLGWDNHVEGAGAELAVAKARGLYWAAHVNVFSGPDVGRAVQVRLRTKHEYDLIIRETDANEHAFVLVTGRIPEFLVHGWIWGVEGKQAKWLEAYGNRPPAYFVPKTHLRPF